MIGCYFFSRHNRFAETHSHLQLSYHITDRLLAAGNDITEKVLKNINKHVSATGAIQRVHGNTGKKPLHGLNYEDIHNAITLITNYAAELECHNLKHQEAAMEYLLYFYHHQRLKKVFTSVTSIHAKADVPALKVSSFEDVWIKCVPHIKISKPRDDVCQRCECLRNQVIDAVTEDEKL